MKKFFLVTLMYFICGVTVPNAVNAMGLFYTDATYPVTATGATTSDLSKLKKGTSSTTNVLFVVEVGDASIDEATKKAGIKKITYVDMNEKSIFIFWRQLTINVYGE